MWIFHSNRLSLNAVTFHSFQNLQFHGVMRFYFQDRGQKVATKCIRVASDATVTDVIGNVIIDYAFTSALPMCPPPPLIFLFFLLFPSPLSFGNFFLPTTPPHSHIFTCIPLNID